MKGDGIGRVMGCFSYTNLILQKKKMKDEPKASHKTTIDTV